MGPSLTRIRDRVRRAAPGPRPGAAAPADGGRPSRTFALGLGAQKAGTSWLYSYLAESPQYVVGYKKEFHVFDAIDFDPERWERNYRWAAKEIEKARAGQRFSAGRIHWGAMTGNTDMYFDYFTGLLASRPRFRLTGDFTPAYASLSRDRVARIKGEFDKRRVRTVGVFLMRDPVERIWSAARMLDRKFPERYDVPPEEVVARYFGEDTYESRTRYDHTLAVMDEVFDPGDRFVGFYEELFDESRIAEICAVLGVRYRQPDFDAVENPSPKGGSALPDEVVRTVARHYRAVYEDVARRFPDKDLERLWPSSRFVG